MRTAAALAFALAVCACAHRPPSMDDASSLAAAEAAFARHSVREDMRAAFLAHLGDDALLSRGGWIPGKAWLRERPAPAFVLDWRPQYVEVAASGELGLSTGPWKVTRPARPDAPPAYGQFVSVWRREAGGAWKVAVDLGIDHPGPSLWNAPLVKRAAASPPAGSAGTLAQAEERFAHASSTRGPRAAYGAHGADDLRFYRRGQEPTASRAAALASAAMPAEPLAWMVEKTESARSGDFGYALGRYAPASSPAAVAGWFLRVWRREADAWRIVIDVAEPRAN